MNTNTAPTTKTAAPSKSNVVAFPKKGTGKKAEPVAPPVELLSGDAAEFAKDLHVEMDDAPTAPASSPAKGSKGKAVAKPKAEKPAAAPKGDKAQTTDRILAVHVLTKFNYRLAERIYWHKELPFGFFCLRAQNDAKPRMWDGNAPINVDELDGNQLVDIVYYGEAQPLHAELTLLRSLLEKRFGKDLTVTEFGFGDLEVVNNEVGLTADISPAHKLLVAEKARRDAEAKTATHTKPAVEVPEGARKVAEIEAAVADALAQPQGGDDLSKVRLVVPSAPKTVDGTPVATAQAALSAAAERTKRELTPVVAQLAAAETPASSLAKQLDSTEAIDVMITDGTVKIFREKGITTAAKLIEWGRTVGLLADEPKSAKAPRAPKAPRNPDEPRRYGVIDHLAALATRPEGVTIAEAAASLVERFPDRDASSMAQTCKVQLGGKGDKAGQRLAHDRDLTVTVTEEAGRGRVVRGVAKVSA